jgi:hypothetical protein
MKKLFFTLSLFYMHAITFSGVPFIFYRKPVKPAPQPIEFPRALIYQPEHLEKILHPVTKYETEEYIRFFGPRKDGRPFRMSIIASLNKATGVIEVNEFSERNGSVRILRSPYNKFPRAMYDALQALHEKQQKDLGEQVDKEDDEEVHV